jgi:hypothetical protein
MTGLIQIEQRALDTSKWDDRHRLGPRPMKQLLQQGDVLAVSSLIAGDDPVVP